MTDRKLPKAGRWCSTHGRKAELAKKRGEDPGLTFETVPDGVRSAPRSSAVPHAPRNGGRFTRASAREAARLRWEKARQPDFSDKVVPWMPPREDLKPFDDARGELLIQRRNEIHRMTGGVSAGVGAMLRGWAYMHAAGEYWAASFFATGDPKAFANMKSAFRAASTEDAKLRDAAAWEATARPRGSDNPFWLQPGSGDDG